MVSGRSEELSKVLLGRDYDKELCMVIAFENLNTDYTATRMLGYLYRYSEISVEMVIDEMIAILSDRQQVKNISSYGMRSCK